MILRYKNSIRAWEGINELLLKPIPPEVAKNLSCYSQNAKMAYIYDISIHVAKPKMRKDFPLGRYFNYTIQKWRSLIGNYVDIDMLKEFKQKFIDIQHKKVSSASLSFSNKYKNGKGCLIAMTAQKRTDGKRYLTIYMRACEVTKRLPVDLILGQRLGEYIFDGETFELILKPDYLFNDMNVSCMYHAHKDIFELLKNDNGEIALSMKSFITKILQGSLGDFKYKIYKRIFKVLRPELFKYADFTTEDCQLPNV